MPLKFNPFTGTFDYTVSAAVEEKAKGIPEGGATSTVLVKHSATNYDDEWALIANANVKAAAGIEESKLSLPEVVVKTGAQTITGLKTFESVTGPEEEKPVNGAEALKISIANGNVNTQTTGTPVAAPGGSFKATTGTGGKTTKATSSQKGGTGGELALKTGAGGTCEAEGTVKATAGAGGLYTVISGEGGSAEVAVGGASVTYAAGTGGEIKFSTGKGGKVGGVTTGAATAGNGGALAFSTGGGGVAENSAKGAGGSGGTIKFQSGGGGNGGVEGTNGKGGPIQFVLGNAAAEANFGAFTVYGEKVEASKARFEIAGGTGLIKIQKSIGLWEHAPPAAQPAEIKPEEITVKALMEKLNTFHKEYGLTA